MSDQGVVVVGDACDRTDRCVIGAGWGQPSLWRRVLEVVALVGHLLEQRTAGVHEPDVRSVRLVRRVQVDVAVERGDVGKAVRCIGHAIDHDVPAHCVHAIGERPDRVDGGGDVRRVGDGKKTGSAGDQFVEVGGIEQAGLRVDRPFLHNDARIGETSPCPLIGLVILPSDDDLVAVVPHRPHGLGQHIRVLTGRRTEMNLALVGRQELGHHRTRAIHRLGGNDRRAKVPVGLTFGVGEEIGEEIDDLARAVAAAGILQVRPLPHLGVRKGGELGPDEIEIEGRHAGTLARTRRIRRRVPGRCNRPGR